MRDSKPKPTSRTSKQRPRTPAQLKKDAARLFGIMNSAEVSGKLKQEIGVLLLEHADPANHYERYPDLFTLSYTIAAKDSGSEQAQAELERILNRLDAGEQLADVVEMRETGPLQVLRPNLYELARHISATLKDPNTPASVYKTDERQRAELARRSSDGNCSSVQEESVSHEERASTTA